MIAVIDVGHEVPHNFDAKDTCKWCGKDRAYHERNPPSPYCTDAPKRVVDAWKAERARRDERTAIVQRAIARSRTFA